MIKSIWKGIKAVYNYIDWVCDRIATYILWVLLAIFLDGLLAVLLVYSGFRIYEQYMYGDINKTKAIYHDIIVQTGQAQDTLPLLIVDEDEDNAYNDGTKIVMYTGFINKHSWDEIALVLGHEVAHGMLAHLNHVQSPVPEWNNISEMGTNGFSSVLEANADKLGAFYMMKAGYDICKGRQIYNYWKAQNGDYQGQNHPDYAYRYDQLNINCGRD